MGFLKKLTIIFLFFLYFGGQLYCDEVGNIITPIGQIHTENTYIRDILKQVISFDDYSRLKALYSIEKIIKIGVVDSIKYDLLSILYYLSTNKDSAGNEKSNKHARKKAIELMGRLGERIRNSEFTHQLASVLVILLRNEDIDMVSSIIFALSMLDYSNEGRILRAIELAVDKWTLITRDTIFAIAVVTSIEKIADANNGIREREGYAILIKIMQSYDDRQIRKKAIEVMNKLNSYE